MNHPIPFQFHTHQVRVFPTSDGLSFQVVAKDIADALGYPSTKDALRLVPEKHKGRRITPTLGGAQEMLCVDEAGMYRLVIRSTKPEAEPFMEWITSEVLPSIRRTGGYISPPTVRPGQVESLQAERQASEAHTLNSLQAMLDKPMQITITMREYMALTQVVSGEREKAHGPVRRFTPFERSEIAELKSKGLSDKAIARLMDRNPSSITGLLKTLKGGAA